MIHLVVPGLLWPRESVADVTRGLELPALHTLLGRGRRARGPAVSAERWLCEAFGVQGDELPFGALRLLGEGLQPGADAWLCADPAHLRFARDTLVIGGVPDLAQAEADQLVATLNAHLAEYGEFLAPHPQRWYLRLARAPRIATHPPSTVVGRTLEPFLPQGDEAHDWRRLINEAQVILHNHPLNAAREAEGRPTANSLWLWGAGPLPERVAAPAARIHAAHPLASGLARQAGVPAAAPPRGFGDAVPQGLTFLETLAEPAQRLDAAAWRTGLTELEARWFAPLLAALKARRLDGLRLTALGDEATVDVSIGPGDLWKLWRRPRTLAELT
jgi:hypothetical protein